MQGLLTHNNNKNVKKLNTVNVTVTQCHWAGLNDGLFSETMDFRDFPSVLSAVRIAQS